MVSCYTCMKSLPNECICEVSEKTKLRRYLKSAIREAELTLHVMNGGDAYIAVGKEKYKARVSEQRTAYKLTVSAKVTKLPLTIKLLDIHSKPLYRWSSELYQGDSCDLYGKIDISYTIGTT